MTDPTMPAVRTGPPPLTWRLLRLHHVRPNGWQRALVNEGMWTLAAILTLADVATAWTLVVLPATALVVLKVHDVLAGWLPRTIRPAPLPPPRAADFGWHGALLAIVLLGFVIPSTRDAAYLLLAAAAVGIVVAVHGARRRGRVPPPPAPLPDGPALADQLAPYESVTTLSPHLAEHMRTAPDPEGADAVEEVEELSRS